MAIDCATAAPDSFAIRHAVGIGYTSSLDGGGF